MKYIIGIDSGATSSEVLLYPLGGGRIIINKYPSINISVLGLTESAKRLIYIVKDSIKKIGSKNVTSVVAGISGARYPKDRKNLERAISKATGVKRVKILPDTEIAFASVFNSTDKNCGIMIAGTGSILYYRDAKGKLKKVGGWGRHIGDEGSGHWIAREALYSVTRYFDGRGSTSALVKVLKREFNIDSKNIVKAVYYNGFEISKITKHVFACAGENDKVSKQIIQNAAENLLTHFIPLKNRKYKIALMGSLFSEEELLGKYLKRLAKSKRYNVEFIHPEQKPVWGAIKIGLDKNS